MRVLLLLACGSLLMHCGCTGPRSRISGAAPRDAFELPDRDRQLIQALAHYCRGLLIEGEQGAGSADALRHFRAAWHNAPERHDLGLRAANVSLAQADPAAAIEILAESARRAPRDANRRADLATAHRAAGDFARAVREYRAASALAPDDPSLYLAAAGLLFETGRDAEALDMLEDARQRTAMPDLSAAFLYQQSNRFVRAGELARAIVCLERLLRWQPDRGALLHHVVAELHALEGNHATSRNHLNLAIERPDALPDSYLDLAASFADEAPAEQADILRAGSERFDGSIRIHYALAYVLAGQDLHREAADAFAEVHDIARDAPERHARYLNPAFYLHYGAVLERDARIEEAAAIFLEGLTRWPEAHRIMNYLAFMWAEQNIHLDDAMRHVERALALDPDNGAYIDTRGWIRYRQGYLEDALTDIERAHELLGDDPEILDHLGDIHAALGNADTALDYWMRSYTLEPGNAELLSKLITAGRTPPDAGDAE